MQLLFLGVTAIIYVSIVYGAFASKRLMQEADQKGQRHGNFKEYLLEIFSLMSLISLVFLLYLVSGSMSSSFQQADVNISLLESILSLVHLMSLLAVFVVIDTILLSMVLLLPTSFLIVFYETSAEKFLALINVSAGLMLCGLIPLVIAANQQLQLLLNQ